MIQVRDLWFVAALALSLSNEALGLKCYVCDDCNRVTSKELQQCDNASNITLTTTPAPDTNNTANQTVNYEILSSDYDRDASNQYICTKVSISENNLVTIYRRCLQIGDVNPLMCSNTESIDFSKTSILFCHKDGCNSANLIQYSISAVFLTMLMYFIA